jgi:PQQ enzyme repeat
MIQTSGRGKARSQDLRRCADVVAVLVLSTEPKLRRLPQTPLQRCGFAGGTPTTAKIQIKPVEAAVSAANLIVTNCFAAMLDSNAGRCVRREARYFHRRPMKPLISSSSLIVALLWSVVLPANAQVNVTQKNNNLSRDGLYIDAAFTPGNAANLTRDLNFDGTIVGNVHAQPLYIEGGPNGPMIIAVTASNNVYALNATNGSIIWQRNVGPPVTSGLPCGNISPFGDYRGRGSGP